VNDELESTWKESTSNRGIIPEFAWRGTEKNHEHLRRASDRGEIQDEHLPNVSPERYCYTNPLAYAV
jgi:hypothetical protein